MSRVIRMIQAGATAAISAGGVGAALFCLPSGSLPLFLLSPLILIIGALCAVPHIALLGVPAYLLLRRFWRVNRWNVALAGALIGAAPMAVLQIATADGQGIGGLAAILPVLGFCAACGAAGGIGFEYRLHPSRTGGGG